MSQEALAKHSRSFTIVLADDEVFISSAYKVGFERAGYTVHTAADGAEALDLVKRITPDAVLLDLIMPKLNGFEVLKLLKADSKLKEIPVIILSNLSQETDRAEVLDLGALDFIIKSDYSLREVIQRVGTVLGH